MFLRHVTGFVQMGHIYFKAPPETTKSCPNFKSFGVQSESLHCGKGYADDFHLGRILLVKLLRSRKATKPRRQRLPSLYLSLFIPRTTFAARQSLPKMFPIVSYSRDFRADRQGVPKESNRCKWEFISVSVLPR